MHILCHISIILFITALPRFIVSVTAFDKHRNFFALTQSKTFVAKLNATDQWLELTMETRYHHNNNMVAEAAQIRNILPITIQSDYRWDAGGGFKIAGFCLNKLIIDKAYFN